MDDATARELLGAYALDACDDGEAAAVEAFLERDGEAAGEALRLRETAAWLGATAALAPAPGLRETLLGRARRMRPSPAEGGDDPALRLFRAQTDRFEALLDELTPDQLDVVTFNGLTVRELVIHMAAMESAFAASVGSPTVDDVDAVAIEPRTYEMIDRFRDRPVADARELWRRSVDALAAWAEHGHGRVAVPGVPGLDLSRHSMLVTRAFETWTHDDDVRRALGRPLVVPPPEHLRLMADVSTRGLPLGLLALDRVREGRRAIVRLTGEGGGVWTVPFEMGANRVVEGAEADADLVLTVDVVDWCRMASQRLAPAAMAFTTEGAAELADDLFAAAPAFATL
ncbi:MAG TPA: maleylpyruvate isomerase family mycothiol-dependent enzyme [Acidimicrobiia bacterium]|jgi:uncharacterized protein (TIGR03083 family)